MYLEVFKHQEMFDLHLKTLNGKQKKHDTGCQELYANMQDASDVFKS